MPAFVLAILLAPICVQAQKSKIEARASDYSYCMVCHGASGNGNVTIQAPAIAGIEPWYLEAQLKSYREKHRGTDFETDPAGTEMRTVAREIDNARIAVIRQYIARFKTGELATSITGNSANGKQLYETSCVACHGTQAEGNPALHAPGLARLNDWYVVASYRKYQSGIRGSSNDDLYGNQMHLIAQALPADFPIQDVASYLNAINKNARKN